MKKYTDLKITNSNMLPTLVTSFMLLALIITGSLSNSHAASVSVGLAGQGSQSGVPLSATIDIDVVDSMANIFSLTITNTSPETSSTEANAPVLTRIGFDTAIDDAGIQLLADASSHPWSYTDRTKPFCGKKNRTQYAHGISADRPAPKTGIARGETGTMLLKIDRPDGGSVDVADLDGFTWAMKFQVVGAGGEDSGCSFGDAAVVTNPSQPVVYYLSELVASAAEGWPGLPTVAGGANVTAAGSVEYNTFGGYGNGGVVPNTNMDPAYQAGIITLRNSSAVEQKQIERRWPPGLDPEGCNPNRGFPECWIWSYDRTVSGNLLPSALDPQTGELTASVPDRAVSSNDNFDSYSPRVTVSGSLSANNVGAVSDNSHQTITATWEVPEGRVLKDETQILFRGRYDWQCNGLGSADVFVPLFYINYADANDNVMSNGVVITEDTPTRLTMTVNVQDALNTVRDAYVADGVPLNSCQ